MVGEVIRAQPLRVPRFWSGHPADRNATAAALGPDYECRYTSTHSNEKSFASLHSFPEAVNSQFRHDLADMMATSAQSYNAPNVMLMRNESPSADTLAAMLASCGAQGLPPGLQGPRSVGGLEEAVLGGAQNRPFYSMFDTSEETGDDDGADDCSHHVEKKRRLAVDQVRSLEKNFELENKLEPERKMQLARELGLQPRQVAVWFQNRRARWKTKQLERDYDIVKLENEGLKGENEILKSDLSSAVEERDNLKLELNTIKAELLRLKGGEQQQDFDSAKPTDVAAAAAEAVLAAPRLSPPSAEDVTKSDQESGPTNEQSPQLRQQHLCTISSPSAAAVADVSPNHEHSSPSKPTSKVPGTAASTCSESNSSEIMNADSPHPIDAVLSPGVDQKSPFTQLSPSSAQPASSNVDSSLVQFAEDLCGGRLVPPQPFQRIVVKTEDGVMNPSSNGIQEECSNYFYNLDESGVLSWWEWP